MNRDKDDPFGCCGAHSDPTCSNGASQGRYHLGSYAQCEWLGGECDKETSVTCPCRNCEGVLCVLCDNDKCKGVNNALVRG